MSRGWPAIEVVRLAADRPMTESQRSDAADETLVAGVGRPPRIREPRPIAALMPQVLASYGLAETAENCGSNQNVQLDILA